jgi:hypothetical protein
LIQLPYAVLGNQNLKSYVSFKWKITETLFRRNICHQKDNFIRFLFIGGQSVRYPWWMISNWAWYQTKESVVRHNFEYRIKLLPDIHYPTSELFYRCQEHEHQHEPEPEPDTDTDTDSGLWVFQHWFFQRKILNLWFRIAPILG